ncbi:ABC transporter ATP-binding protein [Flavobacterium agricola]|uniref:ABC transporter ATP-binding protein n=1 Tax=Flavobacterium agricola TaxID=2870839 RepID=A0ABY6LZ37_9FLAO|nr:ABC transporter ATP-binding protein [Flavobacterium agricola]UYW01593.1 ABC transporter ATP-binding protein [Flavobacterium agricola]
MLTVSNLNFSYKNKEVLHQISFQVPAGHHLAILGESGCGKSTLIKLLYGLFDADSGNLFWNDTEITGPKFNLVPGMKFMKYLAQDFDLMPYATVFENVGKFLSNVYPELKKERVSQLLQIVEMTEYSNTRVQYLSGGQMQRVALAKALALEPEVMLLDEPFSHIDNFRKNSLRRNLFEYLKKKNITCIVATHDCVDALSFADELLILKDGEVVSQGNPLEVYYNPQQKYVASLFGDVNEIALQDIVAADLPIYDVVYKYPNQLIITDSGKLMAVVTNSYFDGGRYIIETINPNNNQLIYVEHPTEIAVNSTVFITLK